jgi:hypothetical protein
MDIYYEEVISSIKELASINPFQTKFIIYRGCVSEEITKNISSMLTKNGIKNKIRQSGFLVTSWFLEITIILPSHLIHEKKEIRKPKLNYIENYIPPCNNLSIGPTIDDHWEN